MAVAEARHCPVLDQERPRLPGEARGRASPAGPEPSRARTRPGKNAAGQERGRARARPGKNADVVTKRQNKRQPLPRTRTQGERQNAITRARLAEGEQPGAQSARESRMTGMARSVFCSYPA